MQIPRVWAGARHQRVRAKLGGAALIVAQLVVGCGKSTRSDQPNGAVGGSGGSNAPEDGGGGSTETGIGAESGAADGGRSGAGAGPNGGGPAFGGSAGSGGHLSAAGTGGVSSGGEGASAGNAGARPGCVQGAPCRCEELVGVLDCDGDAPHCDCPPAEECKLPESSSCFEPCGGDPFGSWVLEDSCFPTSVSHGGSACERVIEGTRSASDLRMRLLDGGFLDLAGAEHWSIQARASLSCLDIASTEACGNARLSANPFVFSISGAVLNCKPNACGVCDCEGDVDGSLSVNSFQWRREGNLLWFGSVPIPYCVQGDELWIGGSAPDIPTMAAYKFKKQSCTGKPVACERREPDECLTGGQCVLGLCRDTGSATSNCADWLSEVECGIFEGCSWDSRACTGSVYSECAFDTCGIEPGCSFGEATERCSGTPLDHCYNRTVEQCAGNGCSVHVCQASADAGEYGDCTRLATAAECAKAPGCTATDPGSARPCTGRPECTSQTDATICKKLACAAERHCWGELDCSTLSVENCYDLEGCRLVW